MVLAGVGSNVRATTIDHVGSGLNWLVPWQAIQDLDDPKETGMTGEFDFVGDAQDAGAYWASTEDYFFFRMRLAYSGTVALGTIQGAHLLMIDLAGYDYPTTAGSNTNGTLPDFAIAWDSKSNNPATHGLEMCVLNTRANTWNGINMKDLDNSNGQKTLLDINGDGRTGEGYVQTVDGLVTTNLGTTILIQYAVSWAYLEANTPLSKTQLEAGQWKFALGSIQGATDHNNINVDMAGGISITDQTTEGWVSPIPEPRVAWLIGFGFVGIAMRRSRNSSGH